MVKRFLFSIILCPIAPPRLLPVWPHDLFLIQNFSWFMIVGLSSVCEHVSVLLCTPKTGRRCTGGCAPNFSRKHWQVGRGGLVTLQCTFDSTLTRLTWSWQLSKCNCFSFHLWIRSRQEQEWMSMKLELSWRRMRRRWSTRRRRGWSPRCFTFKFVFVFISVFVCVTQVPYLCCSRSFAVHKLFSQYFLLYYSLLWLLCLFIAKSMINILGVGAAEHLGGAEQQSRRCEGGELEAEKWKPSSRTIHWKSDDGVKGSQL